MHSWRPPPSSRPEAGHVAWALVQLLLLLRGNVADQQNLDAVTFSNRRGPRRRLHKLVAWCLLSRRYRNMQAIRDEAMQTSDLTLTRRQPHSVGRVSEEEGGTGVVCDESQQTMNECGDPGGKTLGVQYTVCVGTKARQKSTHIQTSSGSGAATSRELWQNAA